MNDQTHYYARVRALELALTLSGSHDYKMKKAEEFYQFLTQGIAISYSQPYGVTIYPPFNTFTTNNNG